MSTTAEVDPDGVVGRLVEHLGPLDAPALALARLARALDALGTPPGSPPLVLPGLDALAAAGAGERPASIGRGPAAPDDLPASLLAGVDRDLAPVLLGQVHEALLDVGNRRRRGAFYTPIDVARGLVADVFARLDAAAPATSSGGDDRADRVPAVCDPALGGGVFLLVAADELARRGVPPADVVGHGLWGSDVDPLAVAVAEAALVLWARGHGVEVPRTNVVCADPLLVGAAAWPDAPSAGFSAVIGNPPFLNQLGSGTSRGVDDATRLRDRFGPAVFRYTDTAAIFLLAATELAAPGGVVAMIVPVPVLVTGDADRLRIELLDRSRLEHLWIARDDIFGLGVRVCAPVLRAHREPGTGSASGGRAPGSEPRSRVTRTRGRGFEPMPAREIDLHALRVAGTWGELVADAFGVPAPLRGAGVGRLGDFCDATAGFRDQYYGLRPYVVEAADPGVAPTGDRSGRRWPKLITSGLIDPVRVGWGVRPSRFDGRRWLAPVVDLDRLEAGDRALRSWTAARLVPKLVVATQTRVLEAAVDVDGDWFPSVPTIAVVAAPGRLWDAAAVVLAPPTTAWAMNRHVGAALSADALRVSAKQLLDAPLPADGAAWAEAVVHLRSAAGATGEADWRRELTRFGGAMTRAYAAPRDVLSWWLERLPRWR